MISQHKNMPTNLPCFYFYNSERAIPLVDGANGAPYGTANLREGNQYKTLDGTIVTWIDDIISVYEPTHGMTRCVVDVWSVFGAPLILKDGTGKEQTFNTENAIFIVYDGAKILIGSESEGCVTKVRYLFPTTEINTETIEGFDSSETTIYLNQWNGPFEPCSKIAHGTL